MNYLEYFGLQAEPFLRAPVARTFYKSAVHGKAVLRLLNAADTPGVFCLVGETGAGKTLLLRRLLDGLSEESARAAYIQVPSAGLDEKMLARVIAVQLRIDAVDEIAALSAGVGELAEGDYNIVVVIDDAHRLSAGVRAKLAELSGIGLILAGRQGQGYPEGEQFELQPLTKDGVDAYVRFRIKMAGRSAQDVVEPEARKRIFELSGGNPARINAVCEQALTMAAMAGAERVTVSLIDDAAVLVGIADADGNPIDYAAEQPNADGAVAAVSVAATSAGGQAETTSIEEEAFDSQPEPSAGELAEEPAAATAAVEDDDFSFDDLALGDDEAEAADEAPAVAAELDDASADAAFDDTELAADFGEPTPEESDDTGGGDLDDVLSQLEDEEPAADDSDDDDLDDLLGGLDDDEPAAEPEAAFESEPEPEPEPEAVAGDESVEDMLAGLAEESDGPEDKGDDGDLDDLLNGLAEEDDTPPEQAAEEDDFESMLDDIAGDSDSGMDAQAGSPPQGDDDLDSLLDGLDDDDASQPEVQADATADESFEDMLGGLTDDDEQETSADDLDDLLSGMSDYEEPTVEAAPAVEASPAASTDDDDLDALLDTMDEDEPAEEKKGDELEDELDSLLKGLED